MIANLTGAAVGLLFGYASQRGAFCLNSGFRVAATRGDLTRVNALLLAVAVQAVGLPIVLGLGLARAPDIAFSPVAAVLGGLLSGAAMRWAGGCAAGSWYKLGNGTVAAAAAFGGVCAGAWATSIGPLAPVRVAVQELGSDPSLGRAPAWLGPVGGAALLVLLARSGSSVAGAWSWRRTGLVVGLLGLASWPLSALAGRDFGLAVIPGAIGLVRSVSAPAMLGTWDVLFVVGIPLGAFLAARRDGPMSFRVGSAWDLGRAFLGGAALGVGSALAGGCTVGHGLGGLPLAAPQSVLAMISIFAGSAVVSIASERSVLSDRPVAPVAP